MIAQQLLKTGILQFGLFVTDDGTTPYRLRLEMLPAYPQLLQNMVYRGIQTLATVKPHDRLVSHAEAIPIATALSLNTGASLVYSQGTNQPAVHDLVGAYDVGHPACLIVNTLPDDIEAFLTRCKTVGLDIHSIVEVVGVGQTIPNIEHHAVFTMPALIHELKQNNAIPPHMATTVIDYLNQ